MQPTLPARACQSRTQCARAGQLDGQGAWGMDGRWGRADAHEQLATHAEDEAQAASEASLDSGSRARRNTVPTAAFLHRRGIEAVQAGAVRQGRGCCKARRLLARTATSETSLPGPEPQRRAPHAGIPSKQLTRARPAASAIARGQGKAGLNSAAVTLQARKLVHVTSDII